MSRTITRRSFITGACTGAAALALGRLAGAQRMGGGGMGGGGMGGGVIDPPVGPRLASPPLATDLSTVSSEVKVSIEARPATVAVNGTAATLWTYNGLFVAPTIRASRGQTVRMHFTNSLPPGGTNVLGHPRDHTNIHVHGWHVSPDENGNADNVHIVRMPGESFDYVYPLEHQRPGSLGLYHPHVHGSVAEQMWKGMVGALDIADDPVTALSGFETYVVLLKDIAFSGGEPTPYTMTGEYLHGKEGGTVTVNGQVNPYLPARSGQVVRLRVVNVSNARFYRLALQGHTLHLAGVDGGLLDKPYPTSELLLAPGERADLLVRTGKAGTYKLLSLPYARQGNMTSAQITLLTLQVQSTRASDRLPAVVDRSATRVSTDTSGLARARFELSMGMGRGYINGVSFTAEDHDMHMSVVDTDEIWDIVNASGMDHPWHQHTNDAQLLSWTGGDAAFQTYARLLQTAPAWKDCIIVPKWGSITMRIPVRHYAGMAMYHCHILEHEDIGMMGMWHIMERMP